MFKVANSKNYYENIGIFSILIIVVLLILSIFSGSNIVVDVFLFLLLELIFISNKYTSVISIDNEIIRITYYKFLVKRELKFNTKDTQIKLENKIAMYGHKYKILNINFRGRTVYSIDTSNNFGNIDIEGLNNYFNNQLKV